MIGQRRGFAFAQVRVLAISVLRYCFHPLENSRSTQRRNQGSSAREITNSVASERTWKRKSKLFSSVLLVERKIQLQNIDSGITEYPEITSIGVLLDKFANFLFA